MRGGAGIKKMIMGDYGKKDGGCWRDESCSDNKGMRKEHIENSSRRMMAGLQTREELGWLWRGKLGMRIGV